MKNISNNYYNINVNENLYDIIKLNNNGALSSGCIFVPYVIVDTITYKQLLRE